MQIPRSEYPRPQFQREEWLCLNGEWQFEIDHGDSGLERGLLLQPLTQKIIVPFCPESKLSGIECRDFMAAVWYRRAVTIPQGWADRRILLHFGAVDYDATVWAVNASNEAVELIRHRGGFTPFTCDLTGHAKPGEEFTIVVRARDYKNIPQPRGKQANAYFPHGCFYDRTTGIWQTVWMEPVSQCYLKRPRITPDVGNGTFHFEFPINENCPGWKVRAVLNAGETEVARGEVRADLDFAPQLTLAIPERHRRVWSTKDPFLYDLQFELLNAEGRVVDTVQSYAGLRSIAIEGKKVKLNGEVLFQRLVLDQGYYPDGIMTAPTDEALKRDIELSLEVGFNGARLHQKVFEERFLYHADRMGYLVWGEFGDWGCFGYGPNADHQQPTPSYITEWLEALERDYSHPSIIGWCGLNETFQAIRDNITVLDVVTRAVFLAAKAMDLTRPILDASGYSHRVPESDVYDSHDYIIEDDFAEGLERYRGRYVDERYPFINGSEVPWSVPYRGQPYFVSEFGGFKWTETLEAATEGAGQGLSRQEAAQKTWGYGAAPQTVEEFYERFDAVCTTLLETSWVFGYCYTQLTDIFPEENGIYTFNRDMKFDAARLRAVQERRAAIEELAAQTPAGGEGQNGSAPHGSSGGTGDIITDRSEAEEAAAVPEAVQADY